jgi:hypothetical protein
MAVKAPHPTLSRKERGEGGVRGCVLEFIMISFMESIV